jgi:prevent-host-death family protein
METVNISTFKATCLSLLRKVRATGEPLLITLHGEPIAQVVPPETEDSRGDWLGSAQGTGTIMGDIIAPTGARWEALEGSE